MDWIGRVGRLTVVDCRSKHLDRNVTPHGSQCHEEQSNTALLLGGLAFALASPIVFTLRGAARCADAESSA